MERIESKISHFQDATGVEDPSICYEILQSHGWDLEAAVHFILNGTVAQTPNSSISSTSDWVPTIEPAPCRDWFPHHQGSGLNSTESVFNWDREDFNSSTGQTTENTMNYHGFRDPIDDGENNHGYLNSSYRDNRTRGNGHQGPGPVSRSRARQSGMMSRIVSLPACIVGGVSRAVGYGMTMAGEMLSHMGMGRRNEARVGIQQQPAYLDPFSDQQISNPLMPIESESMAFLRRFEQQYGQYHPLFFGSSFMDALRMAKEDYKFLFVYLHNPDHPYTSGFCENTLCSELVVEYLDANFVCWGAMVNGSEGFPLSDALRATVFPFCALVMSAPNESIEVLQQIEGPVSSQELVEILQKAVEEQGSALINARLEEEGMRLSNQQLREEQDAAYRAALRTDQERDQRRHLEIEHAAREGKGKTRREDRATTEAAPRFQGRESARAGDIQHEKGPNVTQERDRRRHLETERAAREGKEKTRQEDRAIIEAAPRFQGREGVHAGDIQPEKGPNVTQILIRFPSGDRKERRFLCTERVKSIYNYVDSLGLVAVGGYRLIATFPRRVYGSDKTHLTLKEAGLHPQTSLYLELL